MKILTPDEMAAADQATFSRLGVSSRAVMESAGRALTSLILSRYGDTLGNGVVVLVGGGNNGGDGYVVARALLGLGVQVYLGSLKSLEELSGDALANAISFQNAGGHIELLDEDSLSGATCLRAAADVGVIVDALYGTGMKGPVRSPAKELITRISEISLLKGVPIVSVDIPSGVEAGTGLVPGVAIQADVCASLQCLKLGHVLHPGTLNCGQIVCLDIGVFAGLPEIRDVPRELLRENVVAEILQEGFGEQNDDHKGSRGHLLVLGGSAGHYGAPKMSAEAGLACGAGLVTLGLPHSAAEAVAPELRELMCASLADDGEGGFGEPDEGALDSLLEGKAAIVIGPGMGQGKGALAVLESVLRRANASSLPVVLDADALNLLASSDKLLSNLGANVVLTPHPGEMGRLLGETSATVQENRLSVAERFSATNQCWLALKGARTVISSPKGELWINPAAVATLATGGSGDVLAGVMGAFLARGLGAQGSALAAVFAHGCAGELAYWEQGGTTGTVAGDLLGYVPRVVNALMRMPSSEPELESEVLPGALHELRGELLEF